MRPDGKRMTGLSPVVEVIPYIMPKRYDAQNTVTEYINEEILKTYIREKRREGRRLDHMSVIIAAYYKAVLQHPKLNCFIMNRKIYQRNHFCVSFVMLKKLSDGTLDETTLKIFLHENDNVFKIQQRIREEIITNAQETHTNSTDKFAGVMMRIPGLPRFVLWMANLLDHHGLLPRKLIDLSPFHTSLFITNLASIKTSHIHHHCYEFGTTSVFVCMGKPVPNFFKGEYDQKLLPLGVVMDERICTGYEYAAFCATLRNLLAHPEQLEANFDGSVDDEELPPDTATKEETIPDPTMEEVVAQEANAEKQASRETVNI